MTGPSPEPEPDGAAEPSGSPPDGSAGDADGSEGKAADALDLEAEEFFAEAAGVPALEPPDPFEELAAERDSFRDALIHLQADFENYRKRVAKQQSEQGDRATESLVEKLLPVLDTADLALAHGAGEDVKQLGATLAAALEREGLERIEPAGEPFDPTLHDAVAHEPGDGAGPEVVEVLRAGYRWKGRVLRPAMVKVRG